MDYKSSPIYYGVSKAAEIHLTKELAVRLSDKIRVNSISFEVLRAELIKPSLKNTKKCVQLEEC